MDCEKINICSYNCCSLLKNIEVVRKLTTQNFDIIMLQETFVVENMMWKLDYIDEEYDSVGVSAKLSERAKVAMAGRPEGGMAILLRKKSYINIRSTIIHDNFVVVNITIFNLNIALVNVYIKSDLWEAVTLQQYLQTLSELGTIIRDINFDLIYFIGDFNADPHSGRAWRSLNSFMEEHELICFDVDQLNPDTYTFVGHSNSFCRWLDHVVGRHHDDVKVGNVSVLSDMIGSDHLPLSFSLAFRKKVEFSQETSSQLESNIKGDIYRVNWNKLNVNDINKIGDKVNSNLEEIFNELTFPCNVNGCRNKSHINYIDKQYKAICNAVELGTTDYSSSVVKLNKFKVIPGWNRGVKSLHTRAREKYLQWVSSGRVRGTSQHNEMVESRKNFKQALHECKVNENAEACTSIMEKFINKDKRQFWKEVKKKRGRGKKPTSIDGKHSKADIIDIFKDKYLFNQTNVNNNSQREFMAQFREYWEHSTKMFLCVSPVSLKRSIIRLNNGVGSDGIHSVFLKNASDTFLNILSKFFNACLLHCYLPCDLLKGNIKPIVKNNKGILTDSDNYRPIMQSSCLLKLFEFIILDVLEEKIDLNSRQFGYRKGTSATDACLILKEVMHSNLKLINKGIITFIDLSKAFDSVDHFLLGQKLIKHGIPSDLIFIIMHYLRNQAANIMWQGVQGCYYLIELGVRQGGILSPFLFKLYINEIIANIVEIKEGCYLGITKINIIAYADDIVLLANSIKDMDELYQQFSNDVDLHRLKIN